MKKFWDWLFFSWHGGLLIGVLGGTIATAFAVFSCDCSKDKVETVIPPKRIEVIEATVISTKGYYIIRVDSVEFLVNGTGGICRITK